ncbi:hypothetical protein EMO35_23735, partial [Escherichia coli]|nr:hypothetical protein [Escherichia coli]
STSCLLNYSSLSDFVRQRFRLIWLYQLSHFVKFQIMTKIVYLIKHDATTHQKVKNISEYAIIL